MVCRRRASLPSIALSWQKLAFHLEGLQTKINAQATFLINGITGRSLYWQVYRSPGDANVQPVWETGLSEGEVTWNRPAFVTHIKTAWGDGMGPTSNSDLAGPAWHSGISFKFPQMIGI